MNLYNWDTVFATTQTFANKRLAAGAGSLMQTFKYSEQGYLLEGEFGGWQIVGGAVKLLHVTIPVTKGKIASSVSGSAVLDGLTITAEVSLKFEPSPSESGVQVLVFDFEKALKPTDTGSQGTVRVLSVDDPKHCLTAAQLSTFEIAIAQCLVDGASNLAYVFAEIDPRATGAPSWMAPTASDYCYAQPEQSSEAFLVILSQVASDSTAGLQAQFDASEIKAGCDAYFAVSAELLLKHLVKPAVPKAFGFSPREVSFNKRAGEVVATGSVNLPKKRWGLITYHPKLDRATIAIEDDVFRITAYASCDMHLGESMTDVVISKSEAGLDKSKTALEFKQSGKPVSHATTHSSGGNPPPLPGFLFEWVMKMLDPIITDSIAKALKTKAAKDLELRGAASIVNWGGELRFTASAAGLANNLFVRGNLS